MELNELTQKAHQMAREKGWWDTERNVGELIALIHSEASEALEDYRSGLFPGWSYPPDGSGKPVGFASELADIVIRVADICGKYGIDLNVVVSRKMEYNATRSHRHGGKRA